MTEEGLSPAERSAQTKKRRTRAKLIQAAEQVMSTKGALNARVEDIAKAAGVSAATFYNTFPSKGTIVLTIFKETILAELESLVDRLNFAGHTREQKLALYLAKLAELVTPRSEVVRALMIARMTEPQDQLYSEQELHDEFGDDNDLRDPYVEMIGSHLRKLYFDEELLQTAHLRSQQFHMSTAYLPDMFVLVMLDAMARGAKLGYEDATVWANQFLVMLGLLEQQHKLPET